MAFSKEPVVHCQEDWATMFLSRHCANILTRQRSWPPPSPYAVPRAVPGTLREHHGHRPPTKEDCSGCASTYRCNNRQPSIVQMEGAIRHVNIRSVICKQRRHGILTGMSWASGGEIQCCVLRILRVAPFRHKTETRAGKLTVGFSEDQIKPTTCFDP